MSAPFYLVTAGLFLFAGGLMWWSARGPREPELPAGPPSEI
jgi:hypothetical protein